MAQHALVYGPSGNVQSDPIMSAQPAQSFYSAVQSDPVEPESSYLAPRASAIKEQGFSEAVAA